jgi:hypothetical protein
VDGWINGTNHFTESGAEFFVGQTFSLVWPDERNSEAGPAVILAGLKSNLLWQGIPIQTRCGGSDLRFRVLSNQVIGWALNSTEGIDGVKGDSRRKGFNLVVLCDFCKAAMR